LNTASTPVCRGVRGAITVVDNTAEAILDATRELLSTMIEANQIEPDDIGSVFFTTTSDLNAEYPAVAARQFGWEHVALLCSHEMDVPHGLKRCLRILILWNTTRAARDIHHVYLRDAERLRPDLSTSTVG
jgi:chorismate mutase